MSTHQRLLIALAAAALAGGACANKAPPNHRMPEVGPANSNSSTGMSTPVPIEYLDDLVAEASQWLAAELPNQPEVKSKDYQLVFAVPETLETDLGLPDGRLRQTLGRLQSELQQNQMFSDAFVVISQTEANAKRDIKTVAGSDLSQHRDPLGRTRDETKPETANPTLIYTMSGKFYQSVDRASGRRAFHLFINVNRPQSRSSVLNRDFVYNLRWNPRSGKWDRDA